VAFLLRKAEVVVQVEAVEVVVEVAVVAPEIVLVIKNEIRRVFQPLIKPVLKSRIEIVYIPQALALQHRLQFQLPIK
jgi:hypothetical protein